MLSTAGIIEPDIVCVPLNRFEPVVAYEPVTPSNEFNLPSCVLFELEIEEDKLPNEEEKELLRLLVVVAIDEDKSPILDDTEPDNEPIELLKFDVVVATELDKEPILLDMDELNVLVVVATLELKLPILEDTDELNVFVVVSTLELKFPILDDIDELNVE